MVNRIVLIGAVAAAATALLIGAGIATAQVSTPTVLPDTATTAPGVPVVINVLANDVDPLGAFLPATVSIAAPPATGAATANSDGTITYTPPADFTGQDGFSYTVCDNEPTPVCGTASVTVTVAVPAATPTPTETTPPTLETWPVANPDSAGTDQGQPVTVNVLANDSDQAAALDNTSLTIVTPPANGTATLDKSSGVATYSPNGSYSGIDTFVYQVCDLQDSPHCSQATVTITISPLATATPPPPTATAIATDTPAPPTPTAPVEVATPLPPSTGSGAAHTAPNRLGLLILALVGLGAIGAAGAVAGYTLTNRAR